MPRKHLDFARKTLSLALAMLLGLSLAMHNSTVAMASNDDGVQSVTIVINVTLRHNTGNPRDHEFTYRVRGTQAGATEVVHEVQVDLERSSSSWHGTTTITGLDAGSTYQVSQLRSRDYMTGSYDVNSTRNTRIVDGVRTITFRFTNTPTSSSGLRSNVEDDYYYYYDYSRRYDDYYDDYYFPSTRSEVPSIATLLGLDDPMARNENAAPSTLTSQMETAARNASGSQAALTVKDITHISPSMLQSLHYAATRHGKTAMVYCDTISSDGMTVQGRLFLEPGRLLTRTSDLRLPVYTESWKTQSVRDTFHRTFTNRIAVVSMDQQGSLGARLRVAAKVDLSGLNTSNLLFYSYDRTTGRTSPIANPEYSIDAKGYLHFHTSLGGDIIISDYALTRN